MSATLEIINNYSVETFGRTYRGHQGDADQDFDEAVEVTITGHVHEAIGLLGTGAGRTLWDDDDDNPTGFEYLYFTADQTVYVQLIGATTHAIVEVEADVPFTMRKDTILGAANTTALAAAPSMEEIDSVRIWNQSGNDCNYHLSILN
jgi:hypothetical protein